MAAYKRLLVGVQERLDSLNRSGASEPDGDAAQSKAGGSGRGQSDGGDGRGHTRASTNRPQQSVGEATSKWTAESLEKAVWAQQVLLKAGADAANCTEQPGNAKKRAKR